ncbi:hypothetical protein [Lonsdalea quercina]|uniref:hypothetical protein n=1 Tax=Lonsdalea quercina TaxID=71657 RepID=UPI003975D2A0
MDIIKLNQVCRIQAAGEGGEERIEYEPIYIHIRHIESFFYAGRTVIELASGRRIEVKETPKEIISSMPCMIFSKKQQEDDSTVYCDDDYIPY